MTVGGISSGAQAALGGVQGRGRQRKEGLDALGKALGAGDLEGARKALAQVQQSFQKAVTGVGSTGTVATARFAAVSGSVDALSKSLSAGDLTGAQKAYTELRQGVTALGRGSKSLGAGDLAAAREVFTRLQQELQQLRQLQNVYTTAGVQQAAASVAGAVVNATA